MPVQGFEILLESSASQGGPGINRILVTESRLGPTGILMLGDKAGHPARWQLRPPENHLGFQPFAVKVKFCCLTEGTWALCHRPCWLC